MKQYIIPFLIAVLVLTSGVLAGCGQEGSPERNEAVAFFRGAYPISKEIHEVVENWNAFYEGGSQQGVTGQEILRICQESEARLQALYPELSALYAPPPLGQLKDDIALALNTGIEAYSLGREYALTNDRSYALKFDTKLMECNRILVRIADEWDDGVAYYKIKPSEILP